MWTLCALCTLCVFVKLGGFRAPRFPGPAVHPGERRVSPLGRLQRLPVLPRGAPHVSAPHLLRSELCSGTVQLSSKREKHQHVRVSSSPTRAAAWPSMRGRTSWVAAWRSVMTTLLCRPWAGWCLRLALCTCSAARKFLWPSVRLK